MIIYDPLGTGRCCSNCGVIEYFEFFSKNGPIHSNLRELGDKREALCRACILPESWDADLEDYY